MRLKVGPFHYKWLEKVIPNRNIPNRKLSLIVGTMHYKEGVIKESRMAPRVT